MPVPRDQLPNVDDIRRLAKVNLPAHYVVKGVRVSRGPDTLIGAPDDFEIVIEYENCIGEGLIGSFEDIEAYQDWAHPLIQDIRSEWPAETIRIGFFERLPTQDNPAG
jgi:DNA-binding cell septation regulator SpoVG